MAGSFEHFPEGSGQRAMSENERARQEIDRELQDLRRRAASGENVDQQVRNLQARSRGLEEDSSRIAEGGF